MGGFSDSASERFALQKIVLLGDEHLTQYRVLRLRGLVDHPEAFGETAEQFRARGDDQILDQMHQQARRGGFMLGAASKTGDLIGMVGLALEHPGKTRHRALLWGMYVVPEARGHQVAERLVEEALRRVDVIKDVEQVHLAVMTSNEPAVSLYRKMGFESYGVDPKALKIEGVYFDEYLMVKRLLRGVAPAPRA